MSNKDTKQGRGSAGSAVTGSSALAAVLAGASESRAKAIAKADALGERDQPDYGPTGNEEDDSERALAGDSSSAPARERSRKKKGKKKAERADSPDPSQRGEEQDANSDEEADTSAHVSAAESEAEDGAREEEMTPVMRKMQERIDLAMARAVKGIADSMAQLLSVQLDARERRLEQAQLAVKKVGLRADVAERSAQHAAAAGDGDSDNSSSSSSSGSDGEAEHSRADDGATDSEAEHSRAGTRKSHRMAHRKRAIVEVFILTYLDVPVSGTLNRWCFEVERLFEQVEYGEGARLTDSEQLLQARWAMDADLVRWMDDHLVYHREKGTPILTWRALKKAMYVMFQPVGEVARAEMDLWNLRQTPRESMADYMLRVAKIRLALAGGVDDRTVMKVTLNGANTVDFPSTCARTERAIAKKKIKTFEHLRSFLVTEANHFKEPKVARAPQAASAPSQPAARSSDNSARYGGGKKRIAAISAQEAEERAYDLNLLGKNGEQQTCFRCKSPDHLANKCKMPDPRPCYFCDKPGHLIRDCALHKADLLAKSKAKASGKKPESKNE